MQAFATPPLVPGGPFALRSAAQFRPDGPVAHVDERGRPNRAYVRQARQALRDSRELDDRSRSIAAWDAKRAHDSVRLITAIRELYRGRRVLAWGGPGRGTRAIRGEDWPPYQPSARHPDRCQRLVQGPRLFRRHGRILTSPVT
jgi:hypothetical protein